MVLVAKQLTPYAEALNKATLEAKENAQPGFTSGLFHQETERCQRLRAEATKPLPTTLAQALDLKRKDLGAGTIQNDESQIAAWKEHTGKETLSSVTPTALNIFVRWLHQPKSDGGRGMSKDSANNYGLKLRSLIKAHNSASSEDSQRIPFPDLELLKHSETDKRNKRLEVGKRVSS